MMGRRIGWWQEWGRRAVRCVDVVLLVLMGLSWLTVGVLYARAGLTGFEAGPGGGGLQGAPAPAELEQVWAAVVRFFHDTRLYLVLVLIGLDLVMGIASAIKRGVFQWDFVAQFYQTMVLPYVIGYLALYVAFALVPEGLDGILGQGLVSAAFAAIALNLAGSIFRNLQALGLKSEDNRANARAAQGQAIAPGGPQPVRVMPKELQALADAGFIRFVEQDEAGGIRYVFKEPDETEEEGT